MAEGAGAKQALKLKIDIDESAGSPSGGDELGSQAAPEPAKKEGYLEKQVLRV
jgi:hypothetical protein